MRKTANVKPPRQIIGWVIPKELARGSRPGFSSRKRGQVSQSEVDAWIKKAKTDFGIRSVICLLDENHLRLYEQLQFGLIAYYRAKGLQVEHIAVRNSRSFSAVHFEKIWKAYQQLQKPVLVHCSAGRGRTRRAVSFIKRQLRQSGRSSQTPAGLTAAVPSASPLRPRSRTASY